MGQTRRLGDVNDAWSGFYKRRSQIEQSKGMSLAANLSNALADKLYQQGRGGYMYGGFTDPNDPVMNAYMPDQYDPRKQAWKAYGTKGAVEQVYNNTMQDRALANQGPAFNDRPHFDTNGMLQDRNGHLPPVANPMQMMQDPYQQQYLALQSLQQQTDDYNDYMYKNKRRVFGNIGQGLGADWQQDHRLDDTKMYGVPTSPYMRRFGQPIHGAV
jgi:hypothetical protein